MSCRAAAQSRRNSFSASIKHSGRSQNHPTILENKRVNSALSPLERTSYCWANPHRFPRTSHLILRDKSPTLRTEPFGTPPGIPEQRSRFPDILDTDGAAFATPGPG